MTANAEKGNLKMLNSIKKSLATLNRDLQETLRRLEDAVFRVSALGEVHLKLAVTLMDVLGIPQEGRPQLDFPTAPVESVESAGRVESIISGLLRGIIMSLRKPCGEIAKAISASKREINEQVGNFDTQEMEALAKELGKTPNRNLDPDEQTAYREKIRKWHKKLTESFEKP
jgi:hypothetical protein